MQPTKTHCCSKCTAHGLNTQAHEFFFFLGGGSDVPYDIIMYFQPSSTLWIKLISLLPSMYSLSIYISQSLMKCQSWYLYQRGGINLIFFCALSHFLMRMIKLYINRNSKIMTSQGNYPKKIEIFLKNVNSHFDTVESS